MDNFQNIEDLFKDNLKNFEVTPHQKVWKGVQSNLWYSDIQNIFRNYTLQPANKVWRGIAFRLWFKSFITYSPTTLNVYNSLLVVFAGLSIYFVLNNAGINNNTIKNQVNLVSNLSELSEPISNQNHTVINSRLLNKVNNNENVADKGELATALNESAENDLVTTGIISFEKNNVINTKNILTIHEPVLLNDESESVLIITDNSNISLLKKRSSNLYNENSDINFENRIEPEYDFKKWHWALEGFIMPMQNTATYKVKSVEYSGISKKYSENNISANTISGGLMIQASHMNFSFQAGLSYSEFANRPKYQFSDYSFDTIMVTQIIPSGYYNYYTEHILDLDWYLQTGDTTHWIDVLDSTFISTNDTVTQQQINANRSIGYKRTANTFSYFELPLIAGYRISQGRLNITLRAGVVLGMLNSVQGNIPSPYSEFGTDEILQNSTRKFMLSGVTGLELGYDATNHITIIASPTYRFNLLSLYRENYLVNQKLKSVGIKLGLRYNF